MADPHPYENVSVLVIEDMASVRKLIKNMLIQLGIRAVFEAVAPMIAAAAMREAAEMANCRYCISRDRILARAQELDPK